MGSPLPLSEDQRDCLQEITNVAMGAAAESLAVMTDTFVNLPIPCIRFIDSKSFVDAFEEGGEYHKFCSVSQIVKFSGLNCYALIVISDDSLKDLALCTNRSLEGDAQTEELLQALCHTINKTCFERFGDMIEENLEMDNPSINSLHTPLDAIHIQDLENSSHLVTVDINYHIEGKPFSCDLVLLFPEDSLPQLTQTLDRLM